MARSYRNARPERQFTSKATKAMKRQRNKARRQVSFDAALLAFERTGKFK